MADSTESRERFEKWLGEETCEVHCDESANKNAWYGWQAAEADTRARCAQLIRQRAKALEVSAKPTPFTDLELYAVAEAIEKG